MKQHEIAALFNEIADILEFRGDNVFRIRAYRKAALNLESLTDDLEQLNAADRLTEIPGIGADLASKIREYLTHGSIRHLEELRQAVPPGIGEVLRVPGVGPKTAKLLYDHLKIASLDQLEAAAKAHRLRTLPGFQERKEENVLKGIRIVLQGHARMDLGTACHLAERIMTHLRTLRGVKRIETAGSLRRMNETIGDVDLLVASSSPKPIMAAFTAAPYCTRVLMSGSTKSSILTPHGVQVDLRVVEPATFGAAWQYFTGSKAHNVHLRTRAVRMGLKISEYGVFKSATGKRIAGREEEDVYKAVGLPWIPPEIREDTGEIEAAIKRRLPRLVESKDLRGAFHVHTTWSDGTNTLDAMANAAMKRGYDYAVITDHSQSLKVAHGMSIPRLKEQLTAIRAWNRKGHRLTLLAGAEVDILERGRMDYPDEVLSELDVVIGSIHSGFTQDRATLTARMIGAMKNPYVSIIGHPTGRLMGQRDPYELDLDAVTRAAADTGTALELNAYPKRLDLNDTAARAAQRLGAKVVISTDSHSVDQFDHEKFGVGVARRAWCEPAQVLNCMSRTELLKWVQQKRKRHA